MRGIRAYEWTGEVIHAVHPRVCGEYTSMNTKVTKATGSPPRMRGILIVMIDEVAELGFTPAYAGNTGQTRSLYGEQWGSPPRMRGIYMDEHNMTMEQGFTPAYAGNMPRASVCHRGRQVHPRVCGEYVDRILKSTPV